MNPVEALTACAGAWRGTNTLQDPNTCKPEESPSTATVTPVLGGRFVRLDYTWGYQGKPQEGSLLLGFDPQSNDVSGHWIDTWHMRRLVMSCVGKAQGGTVAVRGSYAAPPGPDWGWRIEIAPGEQALRIMHTNISPDGKEEVAAEGVYTRGEGGAMTLDVTPVQPGEVLALRELHRAEMDCQIILDSWHGRGWVELSYLLRLDGRVAGYGLVGGVRDEPRETITVLYVLPVHCGQALSLFRRLIEASRAKTVEAQSNDILLTLMLYDCAQRIESHVVLFHDALTTSLSVSGAVFREVGATDKERLASQRLDSDARWLVEVDGGIVAVGGLLFHYNVPYGDIFMEVAEPNRRRGYGSYLIQELKRVAYEMGKVPAARCNASNEASRASLQKAGMLPCARMLAGPLKLG